MVLDESGWADSDELIRLANERGKRLTRELIREVVAKNDKQRFTIDANGNRIRANQGRSVEVSLGLAPVEPPELLFHGTVERFLGSIRRHGLRRESRTHVHWSANEQTARSVGARRGQPVVLNVLAQLRFESGHAFYRSDDGVWLTEHVPPQFLGYPS